MKTLLLLAISSLLFGQEDSGRALRRIPTSTAVSVRTIDTIDSSKATQGQNFHATVADDVVVDGQTLVPKGASAILQLVDLDKSGKFKGKAQLGLRLTSVRAGGRMVDVTTGEVTKSSGSQGKNTAVKTGIGAGLGAVIGALAGGGKGAAIGAGAGGAAGAGTQVFTKGQKVQIPSETVLTFVLSEPSRL